MHLDIQAVQAGITGERGAALHHQRIAVTPRDRRQPPPRVALLLRIDPELHRLLRQGNVGAAIQQSAAAQVAVDGKQRIAGKLAVIDVEAAAQVFGGDAAIGGLEGSIGQHQRAIDAQRWFFRRTHHQSTIERSSFQVPIGPRLRRQRLRPGQRYASEVEHGVVGRGGIAMQRKARSSLRQDRIGAGGRQRQRQAQRLARCRTQDAVALPAALPVTHQRALPLQRTKPIAKIRSIDSCRAQAQLALRGARGPVELHLHALQRRHRGADARDFCGHRARLHLHGAGQEHEWQQV